MSTLIDLTPARVDITVTQGDSLTFILAVKDSDGLPVTLTGTVRSSTATTGPTRSSSTAGRNRCRFSSKGNLSVSRLPC